MSKSIDEQIDFIKRLYGIKDDDFHAQVNHLITKAVLEAENDYIKVTLGWIEANKDNLTVNEIIQAMSSQLKPPKSGDK